MPWFMRKNNTLDKTIIFFSNPFGYGPTGKVIALLDEFSNSWKGDIVCVANGLTGEMHDLKNKRRINFIKIDERNEEEIVKFLRKFRNPYVVSSLNRFAIKSANMLNIPSAIIDSLAWFWRKTPEEYLLADFYYCQKMPGISIKKISRNQKFVPAILGKLPKPIIRKKNFTLIHIGGISNPLTKEMPEYYLRVLAYCINNYDPKKKIIVAGGKKAISLFKKHIRRKNIILESFSRKEFINQIRSAKHFVTTSGLTATLEAFFLKTPTSFLLPTNLSQWSLAKNLSSKKCAPKRLLWEKYIKNTCLSEDLTEKETINILLNYGEAIYKEKKLLKSISNDFRDLLTNIPEISYQNDFISKMGSDGSKIISKELVKKWS